MKATLEKAVRTPYSYTHLAASELGVVGLRRDHKRCLTVPRRRDMEKWHHADHFRLDGEHLTQLAPDFRRTRKAQQLIREIPNPFDEICEPELHTLFGIVTAIPQGFFQALHAPVQQREFRAYVQKAQYVFDPRAIACTNEGIYIADKAQFTLSSILPQAFGTETVELAGLAEFTGLGLGVARHLRSTNGSPIDTRVNYPLFLAASADSVYVADLAFGVRLREYDQDTWECKRTLIDDKDDKKPRLYWPGQPIAVQGDVVYTLHNKDLRTGEKTLVRHDARGTKEFPTADVTSIVATEDGVIGLRPSHPRKLLHFKPDLSRAEDLPIENDDSKDGTYRTTFLHGLAYRNGTLYTSFLHSRMNLFPPLWVRHTWKDTCTDAGQPYLGVIRLD